MSLFNSRNEAKPEVLHTKELLAVADRERKQLASRVVSAGARATIRAEETVEQTEKILGHDYPPDSGSATLREAESMLRFLEDRDRRK